jgi:hypothetical protein
MANDLLGNSLLRMTRWMISKKRADKKYNIQGLYNLLVGKMKRKYSAN